MAPLTGPKRRRAIEPAAAEAPGLVPRPGLPVEWRRARWAVSAYFLIAGFAFASWATRVPAVQERLELSAGGLTIALLGLNGGAVAATLVAGRVVRRYGGRNVLRVAGVAYLVGLCLVSLAPTLSALTAALAVFAGSNTLVDVAMNAQGLIVEQRYGRPIISRMHATFSAGGLFGGLVGSLAAFGGVDLRVHFVAVAVALGGLLVVVSPALPRAAAAGRVEAGHGFVPRFILLVAGMMCFAALMGEGVLNDWGAVFLTRVAGSGPAVAAAGFALFSAGMVVGRLAGDPLRQRAGGRRVLVGSAAVATAGAALPAAFPAVAPMLAGFTVLGVGLGAVVPVLIATVAGANPERSAGVIAAVSGIGYLGFLGGPVLVGGIASALGLPGGLVTLPALGVLLLVLSAQLRIGKAP
jgi:MFS family permease